MITLTSRSPTPRHTIRMRTVKRSRMADAAGAVLTSLSAQEVDKEPAMINEAVKRESINQETIIAEVVRVAREVLLSQDEEIIRSSWVRLVI